MVLLSVCKVSLAGLPTAPAACPSPVAVSCISSGPAQGGCIISYLPPNLKAGVLWLHGWRDTSTFDDYCSCPANLASAADVADTLTLHLSSSRARSAGRGYLLQGDIVDLVDN